MGTSRRRLSDALTGNGLVRNVIGPKVLEPIADWYDENLRDDPGSTDGTGAPTVEVTEAVPDPEAVPEPAVSLPVRDEPRTASSNLGSARTAELFLAEDGQDAPTPRQRAVERTTTPVTRPPVGGFAGFKDIATRVRARVKHHNLNVVAAGIAFWGLLAIPAILTATLSIYGLVSSPEDVENQIDDILSGVSPEARDVIGTQLENISGGAGSSLAIGAIVGIVLALWSSSGAVAKMIHTMNQIWEVREDRKFLELRGVAIAITFGAIAFFAAMAFTLAVAPALLGETALGTAAKTLISIGRFPAMLVFMALGLTFLYWFGPNRHTKWRLLTWGAGLGTGGWLIVSGLFSLYTTFFASYNETYAGIGSIVVVLLWLFITAFMVLIGAEIDAAREERDRELRTAEA